MQASTAMSGVKEVAQVWQKPNGNWNDRARFKVGGKRGVLVLCVRRINCCLF